ncbi:MAG: response regulator [Steroidobacteraceae bacterium]|nr:response regulator [Steroidobacteraceae bacterium]
MNKAGDTQREDKVNVLLVDDQPARLLSYQTILAELGQNLVLARSGEEALRCLMEDEFAVVLLDVSMPGMDGFETASLIHEHPRFERTPIIFVTGVHVTELDRMKGYKLGAVDYVYIPVVPEILRSKVSVLVELHCQRRELQRLNRSLAEANARLELANTNLQAEKTRELERLNKHLKRANAELEQTNRVLQSEVAERARAEAALKDADRQKDEFLAVLAHELRNPLAPIRNAVEIMRRSALADPQLVWSRDVIERQVKHLTRLVDDLLDVSRITRGNINLSREAVPVATIVARAIETIQPLIAEQRHELVVEMADETLEVDGDITRLTQVLGNLLNNAAKYTDPGGTIRVSVRREGTDVEIRVRDNGIGIPRDLLPRLFQLFTQVDAAAHRAQGGLGIGLALVRQLVQMHGGSVTAYSDGPGHGSEFLIRLPLRVRQTRVTMTSSSHPLDGTDATRSGLCILLADDNRDALDSLATLLQCDGHEVHTAADGAEALERAAQCRPNVILLDIGMPKLDGYEVARRIRAEPWGKSTVLIALTGWGQDEDRRRSREVGFDTHLVKPLDPDALSSLLARLPMAAAREA